jgi:hypothetical protein
VQVALPASPDRRGLTLNSRAIPDVAATFRRDRSARSRRWRSSCARSARAHPIEGHTDNLGTRGYNVELSRRRAEVVAREFVANGFPDATIERKAWGFEHPVASNDTPEGRALNRRVAIVVVAAGPAAD